MIRISIIEDNDTIREGLCLLVNATDGMTCVGKYDNCEDMLENALEDNPEVVLMDIGLPGMSGIEGVHELRQILPEVTIVMLTVYEENDKIFDALCAGASGYLVKKTSPAQLIEAIKEAHNGGSPMSSHIARKVVNFFQMNPVKPAHPEYHLSKRETEILASLSRGNSYKLIADELFISIDTVRFHIRNIYKKLHVNSQTEAVARAFKDKLI
jgi:DNA-binding NarL/FixJ family response regulator